MACPINFSTLVARKIFVYLFKDSFAASAHPEGDHPSISNPRDAKRLVKEAVARAEENIIAFKRETRGNSSRPSLGLQTQCSKWLNTEQVNLRTLFVNVNFTGPFF